MGDKQQPLLAPADGVVESKRWVVLLIFSWIEFNQVHTMHALCRRPAQAPRVMGDALMPSASASCRAPVASPGLCVLLIRCDGNTRRSCG
eukprot:COSAG02_NODE_7092_length_3189_cov_2.683172_4_plen_90_part_00